MNSAETKFADISFHVAKQFLHTVVVVDDRAAYTENDGQSLGDEEVILPKDINLPGIEQAVSEQEVDEASSSTSTDRKHNLDAKEVVNAFAEQGLVCAILRPEDQTEKDVSRSTNAATRADLVVLDWQIQGDNGKTTKSIIRRILHDDDGRLRLIAIYTGEQDLIQIAKEVEVELEQVNLKVMKDEQNPCTIDTGRVRIEIFSKSNYSLYRGRNVSFEELPERLIACFSQMTAGLVSNAAVNAVSSIRSNTHKLLSRLHKNLSAAYLVQYALTSPDDAVEFLGNLVASEFHSILTEYGLEEGHKSAIECWLADSSHWRESLEFDKLTKENNVLVKNLQDYLINGKKLDNGVKKALSQNIQAIHADLAALAAVRSYYSTNPRRTPMLSLGTVVASLKDGIFTNYMLCIQPRCDSVRLDQSTVSFPFLRLETKEIDKGFSFVLKKGKQDYIYLKINPKPSSVCVQYFSPDLKDQTIRATYKDNNYIYQTADGLEYIWVAELKDIFAQRVVQQFASDLSRVGFNEMEWLRLANSKKDDKKKEDNKKEDKES